MLEHDSAWLPDRMSDRFDHCLAIALRKNADYTGGGDPFKNFRLAQAVGVPVARGILVRITDKVARISTLLDQPPAVADEALTDSIDDAINYLAILGAWLEDHPTTG
jgi:hypothetical protein